MTSSLLASAASLRARRARLDPQPHAGSRHDCLVCWRAPLASGGALQLYYVPDRLICAPQAFEAYCRVLAAEVWEEAESLAATVIDDINNELIPRWARVTVRRKYAESAQCVTIEDRQPGWRNADLLSRLEPVDGALRLGEPVDGALRLWEPVDGARIDERSDEISA